MHGKTLERKVTTSRLVLGKKIVRLRLSSLPLFANTDIFLLVSEKDKYVAELMRQDFYRLVEAARPLLLSHGYFGQTIDTWTAKVKEELSAMEKKAYVRVSLKSASFCSNPIAHLLSLSVALFMGDQARTPL